jgi:hypothetical protein
VPKCWLRWHDQIDAQEEKKPALIVRQREIRSVERDTEGQLAAG